MLSKLLDYLFPKRKLKRELEIVSRILYNHVNGRYVISDEELEKISIRHLELHHMVLMERMGKHVKF